MWSHSALAHGAMQVDLAVAAPANPHQFLLGIECDADSHRAEATRDRERIQGEVLTGLGWSVYRLYLTKWWYDPETTFANLVAAIEAAKRGERVNDFGRIPSIPINRHPLHTAKDLPPRPLPAYKVATQPLNLDILPEGWVRQGQTLRRTSQDVYFDPQLKRFMPTQNAASTRHKAQLTYSTTTGHFELHMTANIKGQNYYFSGLSSAGQLASLGKK